MSEPKKKFAVLGCGFWAQYQIAAWQELPGAELIAVCDPDQEKAKATAAKFGVARFYQDAHKMLKSEDLDFVDIISSVETHASLVMLAADHNIPAICQKPLGPDLKTATAMVGYCQEKGVPLFVHENFRWQAPIRRMKALLKEKHIGRIFKGRLSFCSAFPVFENQPFLAELDRFIITDIGSHILDMARFLMGEVSNLRCLTQRVNSGIRGEDVANVLMEMTSGAHCYVEMSYASVLEKEAFPETLILLEGEKGSLKLEHDGTLSLSTQDGTSREKVSPTVYDWVEPDYALIQSCMVDINRNFLRALQEGRDAEITGADNLKTMQLVYASYDSAEQHTIITIN